MSATCSAPFEVRLHSPRLKLSTWLRYFTVLQTAHAPLSPMKDLWKLNSFKQSLEASACEEGRAECRESKLIQLLYPYLGNALNVPVLERQTLQLQHSQVLVELDAVDDRLHEAIEDEARIDHGLLAEESSAVFRIDRENHIYRTKQPH